LLALLCALVSAAAAQSPKPNDDKTIETLLNEVRLLRETLQRSNLNTYRAQIIVERTRAQNDRVTRLARSLEDTRDQIGNLQLQISYFGDRIKWVEGQLQQENDKKQQLQLEAEQRELKYSVDQRRSMVEQMREREARLAADLQTEQGKLSDLEARLDAIEREIENEMDKQRPANPEKPQKRQP
jgi:predicted  nucleic acid-binding Zn-ribbon protein